MDSNVSMVPLLLVEKHMTDRQSDQHGQRWVSVLNTIREASLFDCLGKRCFVKFKKLLIILVKIGWCCGPTNCTCCMGGLPMLPMLMFDQKHKQGRVKISSLLMHKVYGPTKL